MNFEQATTSLMDLANKIGQNQPAAKQAVSGAAASGNDLWTSFMHLNWSNPTWDLIILVFFILAVLIYTFALGRDRIVAVLVSTYVALAVATNLPFMDRITELIHNNNVFKFQASSFIIIFVLVFILASRGSLMSGYFSGSLWQVVILSILQIGLMISIVLSFLPTSSLTQLSEYTKIIFLGDFGKFCWIVLPILALAFFRGSGRRY